MSLSIKQKMFCEHYVKLGNATEAAKLAGYKEESARNQGSRLMRNDYIQEYIASIVEEHKNKNIASAQEVLEFFTTMMRSAKDEKNKLRAAENLAKRMGLDREDRGGQSEGSATEIIIVPEDATEDDDATDD